MKRYRVGAFLAASLLLLSACKGQPVEKVGVLPERDTLLQANNVNEEVANGHGWDVEQIDEIRLDIQDQVDVPVAHFFNGTLGVETSVAVRGKDGLVRRAFQEVKADGQLAAKAELELSDDSRFAWSADGRYLLYEYVDAAGALCLRLYDAQRQTTRQIWSNGQQSKLQEQYGYFDIELCFAWSHDGGSFFFMPVLTNHAIEGLGGVLAAEAPDLRSGYQYRIESEELTSWYMPDEMFDSYEYYEFSLPMIAVNENGTRIFVYMNQPNNKFLVWYLDGESQVGDLSWLWETHLEQGTEYFAGFSGQPVFYKDLLYLPLEGMGFLVLNQEGQYEQFYPFQDPIQAFTIYDDLLIVAQPSAQSGIDVTAYHLGLDRGQSILLYHSNQEIVHMEIDQTNGASLLIEEESYDRGVASQKLLLLRFQA